MEHGEAFPRSKTPLGLRRVRYVQLEDSDQRIVPVKVWERGLSSVLDSIEEIAEHVGDSGSPRSPTPLSELNQGDVLLKSEVSSRVASPRVKLIEVLPASCSRVSSPILSTSSSALDGRRSRNSICVGIGGQDSMACLEITPRAQRSSSLAEIETCKTTEKYLPSEGISTLSAQSRMSRTFAKEDLDIQGFSEPPMPAAVPGPLTSSEGQMTDAMLGLLTQGEGHVNNVSLDNRVQLGVSIKDGESCSATGESNTQHCLQAPKVKKAGLRKQISHVFRRISRPFRACFGRSLVQD